MLFQKIYAKDNVYSLTYNRYDLLPDRITGFSTSHIAVAMKELGLYSSEKIAKLTFKIFEQ